MTMTRYLIACFSVLVALLISLSVKAHESKKGFIENRNQFHENVVFQADFYPYTVFLEQQRFTFLYEHPEDLEARHDIMQLPEEERMEFYVRAHAYRVNFVGSSPNAMLEGGLPHSFKLNYFLGNEPDKWASSVQSFKKVKYHELYQGVDLLAVVDNDHLKYDFIVKAGSDPGQIQLDFEGLDDIYVNEDGDLVLVTSVGEMKELKPFAYQMQNGALQPVACNYSLNGTNVSFALPDGYDETRDLVIDPVVVASTLSGTPGGGSNYGHGATYDLAGNVYSHAIAFGAQYPTTPGVVQPSFGGGNVDVAISKYNPTGTDLLYATYLGGSGADYPHSTVTNQFEELYVYGTTRSTNYPTTSNAFDQTHNGDTDGFGNPSDDIFITKLSADGTQMLGSTFVGGSGIDGRNTGNSLNYGDQYRGEIVVDVQGFPYVVSQTFSTDFPVTIGCFQGTHQGGQDAVVFKMTQNLTDMVWCTYLGSSENDTGYGIRTTVNGTVYVSGSTRGDNFPTSAGAYMPTAPSPQGTLDGFVARISNNGSALISSTFLGTSSTDQAFFVDLDNDEVVWVYGQTQGDWPVVGDGNYSTPNGRMFVSKLNPALSDLLISSRIGPGAGFSSDGIPVAFLVDRCDRIYICAYNSASGWELTPNSLFQSGSFVLCAWEEDMSELAFGTYYGGNHVDGGTSRFDKSGIVYQGVCNSGAFPTNPDAWATSQSIGWDIGVFKIDFQLSGVNAAITTNDDINGCAPHTVQFNNYSIGDVFIWNFGDGSPISNEFEPQHTFTEPGSYTISLISYDSLSCNLADTAYLFIDVGSADAFTPSFSHEIDCETSTVTLTNETGAPFLDYVWDMGDGTTYNTENAVHTYDELGVYNIVLTATDNACDNTEIAEQEVEIFGALIAEIGNEQVIACQEVEVQFENLSNGESYIWDFGDGTTSEDINPTHTFFGPGIFEVTLTAFHSETCNSEDQATVTIAVGQEQTVSADFIAFQTDCESFIVETINQSEGENLSFTWDMGDGTQYTSETVSHQYTDLGTYTISLSIEDTLCLYTNNSEQNITVSDQATAVAGTIGAAGCPPLEVTFQNFSTGQDYFWDFGDGNTSTEFAPEHVFETSGEYEVMLVVSGFEGCPGQDTTFATVSVTDNTVEALFTAMQTGYCQENLVSLHNLSDGDGLQITWNLNGEEIHNQDEFIHAFPGAGTYNISLTATEPNCLNSDTYSETVEVLPGFNVDLGPDRDICYYQTSQTLETGLSAQGLSIVWSTGESDMSSIVVTSPGT